MSETRTPETTSNVTPIAAAFDKAKRVPKKKKDAVPATSGGPPSGGGEIFSSPKRLPPNSPVTALGCHGIVYHFLDSRGQYISASVEKLGRLFIIGLFGDEEYLIRMWPAFDRKGRTKDEFDHGKIAPVLIGSCADKPLFNPIEQVRGPGAWREDDGAIVMHCGDALYTSAGEQPTGLRRGYLYPAGPALPAPAYEPGKPKAAREFLEKLQTWTWQRGAVDAKLALGWLGAAMIGGASEWRPMIWVTGGAGSGKSTFQKLLRWGLGPNALIRSEDATRAYVFQRVGYSSLPVALDEFENQANNQKRQEIIDLARASSSGGVIGRGGADGTPSQFTARNPFAFSSILIPPLQPADRSRMAILELMKRPKGVREPGDDDAESDDTEVLGSPEDWTQRGQYLRGRILQGWRRYYDTFRAYRRALIKGGHSDRAADQFAALGAAYDLLMFEALEAENAERWAAMLPAVSLAETTGYMPDEEACLMHLLTAMPQVFRSGAAESIGHWLMAGRKRREDGATARSADDENRVLAKTGLKIYRDERVKDGAQWWIAIANDHRELAKMFEGTKWGGMAGAAGAWSQALLRIDNAVKGRLRFDHRPLYCVSIPWEAAFPGESAELDRDEHALVDARDRDEHEDRPA